MCKGFLLHIEQNKANLQIDLNCKGGLAFTCNFCDTIVEFFKMGLSVNTTFLVVTLMW